MTQFILDASVALRWFLDSSAPPYATKVRQLLLGGAVALVPALWHLEMANGLVVAQRRGFLTSADVDRSLLHIEQLLTSMVECDVSLIVVREALLIAEKFQVSAYDAAYLAMARRVKLPLATLDQGLRQAAKTASVEIVS